MKRSCETYGHGMEAVVETLREQFHGAEERSVDPAKVKAAILARRKASRAINQEWENVDRETTSGPREQGYVVRNRPLVENRA